MFLDILSCRTNGNTSKILLEFWLTWYFLVHSAVSTWYDYSHRKNKDWMRKKKNLPRKVTTWYDNSHTKTRECYNKVWYHDFLVCSLLSWKDIILAIDWYLPFSDTYNLRYGLDACTLGKTSIKRLHSAAKVKNNFNSTM